jgi:5'-3' exonuclease
MNTVRPSSVHVFWDAPRNTVWRRSILPTYKDRTQSTYVEDISEDLAITTNVAKAFLEKMGVRQYERKEMEADDLIYTAVSIMHPRKTVIVSTDSDMIQIPYRYTSSSVFDPKEMKEVPVPSVNPVHLKALIGDKADSIDGYYGIGPKKGQALMENQAELYEYLAMKGPATFRRNLLLIDLSMCPRLLANSIYVHKKLAQPVEFVKEEIHKLIMTHKVNGLQQEFTDLVLPFKNLV